MDKNTLSGLLLIGVILFGFSWFSQKQQSEINAQKATLDSIELVQKTAEAEANAALLATQDSVAKANEISQKVANYGQALYEASQAPEKLYTLENDKMVVTISSKGGAIVSAELKDYKTYEGKPLMLFNKEESKFNMSFYLRSVLNTADFNFTEVKNSNGNIALRLNVDSLSYIEFDYNLAQESNMVDFKVNLEGMGNLIAPSQNTIAINWSNIAPQQERGYKYEAQYESIAFKPFDDNDIEESGHSDNGEEESEGAVEWVAFKQQFFSSIFVAKENFGSAKMSYKAMPEGSGNIRHFFSNLTLDYTPQTTSYDLGFYFGPNDYKLMKSYDSEFQELIPMGSSIIGWVNRFIVLPTFDFLSKYISNYGWIIFLLTIFIKLIIFPFTYKSYLSMAKMRLIKPEMDAISAKYPDKDDAMKKQQEVMDLYKKAGVSPLGGCLPMLFQFPILIAMFRFFPASIQLRGEHFLWATDLSSYDSILNLPFNIPFYGNHVSLFALLMGISMFVSTKISMTNSGAQNNAQIPGMSFMTTYLMPVMLVVWFNSYSSALSYYYLLSNIITVLQTVGMRRFVDDAKLHLQMKENSKKPQKASKWQERYQEMLKQQEEMNKQQKGRK